MPMNGTHTCTIHLDQCDQTAGTFFIIWLLIKAQICPKLIKKIVKSGSTLFQTLNSLPNTFESLPKLRNFAKSGHTDLESLHCSRYFFCYVFSLIIFWICHYYCRVISYSIQRIFTYFLKGSITVQLTSCFTGFDSAALQSHLYQGRKSGHAFFLLACIDPVMSCKGWLNFSSIYVIRQLWQL